MKKITLANLIIGIIGFGYALYVYFFEQTDCGGAFLCPTSTFVSTAVVAITLIIILLISTLSWTVKFLRKK
jgi:hypothetical protein